MTKTAGKPFASISMPRAARPWQHKHVSSTVQYSMQKRLYLPKSKSLRRNQPRFSSGQSRALIEDLLNDSQIDGSDKYQRIDAVKRAFKIYHQTDDRKKHLILGPLAQLCFKLQCPTRLLTLWNVMEQNQFHEISLVDLLQSCIDAGDVVKSITILRRMTTDISPSLYDHERKRLSRSITKLIALCNEDLDKIQEVHSALDRFDGIKDIFIKTALIKAFGNCKDVTTAGHIFKFLDEYEVDTVSMCTMMKAFITNDHPEKALSIYDDYPSVQNDVSHLLAISACTDSRNFEKGKNIIDSKINVNNASINMKNQLIHFYGELGSISDSEQIFESINSDEVTTATLGCLMKALVSNGMNVRAMLLYHEYSHLVDIGITLNVIQAYSNMEDIKNIQSIYYDSENDVKSRIIGSVMEALIVNDCGNEAICIWKEHLCSFPQEITDISTIATIMRACMKANAQQFGMEFINHVNAQNGGHIVNTEVFALFIEFYGYFGEIENAQIIFNSVSISDDEGSISVVTKMMKSLVSNALYSDALTLYHQYQHFKSDLTHLHIAAIKTCIKSNDCESGKQIYSDLIQDSHDRLPVPFKNTLIHFFGHFFDIATAETLFDSIADSDKTIATIGAMMNAYCDSQHDTECIELFQSLKHSKWPHLIPDMICYTLVIRACYQSTSYHIGHDIYMELMNNHHGNHWMLSDSNLQCGFIDFYGKCGDMEHCTEIFERIKWNEPDKYRNNIYIWNSMMNAFGRNGEFSKAKETIDLMIKDTNLTPNRETLVAFINCCVHCGETAAAQTMWEQVRDRGDMKVDVYDSVVVSSLIDCYSRNGLLNEAYALLMQYEGKKNERNVNDRVMWITILNACRVYGNEKLAVLVYDRIQERYGAMEC